MGKSCDMSCELTASSLIKCISQTNKIEIEIEINVF